MNDINSNPRTIGTQRYRSCININNGEDFLLPNSLEWSQANCHKVTLTTFNKYK